MCYSVEKKQNKLTLNRKYDSRLSVKKKIKDLYFLKSKIIPKEYASFIQNIPTATNLLADQ